MSTHLSLTSALVLSLALLVRTPAAGQSEVTPDGASRTEVANLTGRTAAFWIYNGSFEPYTFWVTCSRTGAVTGCSTPNSVTVNPFATKLVSVTFSTGSPGTGRLELQAESASGWYDVTVVPPVTVSPDGHVVTKPAGATTTQTFTVTNQMTTAKTFNLGVTCPGATFNGCSVATSVQLSNLQSKPVDVTYTLGSTPSAGTLTLTATDATNGSSTDNGTVVVTSVAAPSALPVTTFEPPTPSDVIARDHCVSVAVGDAAAYECADLRLVHALPTTRALNKTHTPTLIYNSQHAHPYPILERDVTAPGTQPTSVVATLLVNNVQVASVTYAGSDWAPGATRRIGVGFDAMNLPTTAHPFTLTITVNGPSGVLSSTQENSELIVVNRATSPYGAGWWVAGVEQLLPLTGSRRLWVGGDGSARIYVPDPVVANRWNAPNVDRPDVLDWDGMWYWRRLRGGVSVGFDSAGKHKMTVNPRGHRMNFSYDGARLDSIIQDYAVSGAVSRTGLLYTLAADPVHTDRVGTITSGTRSVVLNYNGTRLGSIQDPDLSAVSFGYSGGLNRIASRTNRRLHATNFLYDATGRLIQSTLAMGGDTASIITRFRPLESKALIDGHAIAPATGYTHLDGPRTDVADTTIFWLGRYGAVRQVRDAAWRDTRVTRGDPTWPGVATQTERFDGFTQRAFYGASRALLDSTVVVNPLADGRNAVTRYEWDTQWDKVTRVVTQEGPSMRFDYHDTTGVRLWEQPGDDPARRVIYGYTPFSLIASVTAPGESPDSLYYDSVTRNLNATRTPMGFWSRFLGDAFGRDTLVITPADSTQPGQASLDATGLRQRTFYDAMDRDTLARTISPAVGFSFDLLSGGAPVETLTVRKVFDAERATSGSSSSERARTSTW